MTIKKHKLPTGMLILVLIGMTACASITPQKGIAEINRENQKSLGIVTARLDNRDLGSTLAEIKTTLTQKLSLPAGYTLEYGGAYKEQQQAFKRPKEL